MCENETGESSRALASAGNPAQLNTARVHVCVCTCMCVSFCSILQFLFLGVLVFRGVTRQQVGRLKLQGQVVSR